MVEPMRTLADYHTTAQACGCEIVHQALMHELWEITTQTLFGAWALNGGRNEASVSHLSKSS